MPGTSLLAFVARGWCCSSDELGSRLHAAHVLPRELLRGKEKFILEYMARSYDIQMTMLTKTGLELSFGSESLCRRLITWRRLHSNSGPAEAGLPKKRCGLVLSQVQVEGTTKAQDFNQTGHGCAHRLLVLKHEKSFLNSGTCLPELSTDALANTNLGDSCPIQGRKCPSNQTLASCNERLCGSSTIRRQFSCRRQSLFLVIGLYNSGFRLVLPPGILEASQ